MAWSTAHFVPVFIACFGSIAAAETWKVAIESETIGFDREIILAASRIGNGDVRFVPVSSNLECIEKLVAGEVDAAAGIQLNAVSSGMPIVFSSGYRVEQLRGFALKDSKLRGMRDVNATMAVAVKKGSTAHNYAKSRGWKVVPVESSKAAFELLLKNQCDLLVSDQLETEIELAKARLHPQIRQLSDSLPSGMLTVAVAESNREWLANFNAGLRVLERTGHVEMLWNRWDFKNRNSKRDFKISVRTLGVTGILLMGVTILLMRSQILTRTKFPVPAPSIQTIRI
tara:strand:- start:17231 stop:18085 length:855 start_codon:yes stop_codon:yes gene_type:complete